MRSFEYINMPDYYTRFLTTNMHVGAKGFNQLRSEVFNNKSLNAVFKNSFSDIDPNLDIDVVVKSMGWDAFRNRLASVFINYNDTSTFDPEVDKFVCSEVLEFEQKLKKFTVSGYSRAFLLGFYLKLWNQQLRKNRENVPMQELLDISGPILEILEKSRARIVRIDWAVVAISQLLRFLNKDIVISMFTQDIDYKELYQILDDDQKSEFITNMLAYGSSINDQDIFLLT